MREQSIEGLKHPVKGLATRCQSVEKRYPVDVGVAGRNAALPIAVSRHLIQRADKLSRQRSGPLCTPNTARFGEQKPTSLRVQLATYSRALLCAHLL